MHPLLYKHPVSGTYIPRCVALHAGGREVATASAAEASDFERGMIGRNPVPMQASAIMESRGKN